MRNEAAYKKGRQAYYDHIYKGKELINPYDEKKQKNRNYYWEVGVGDEQMLQDGVSDDW